MKEHQPNGRKIRPLTDEELSAGMASKGLFCMGDIAVQPAYFSPEEEDDQSSGWWWVERRKNDENNK